MLVQMYFMSEFELHFMSFVGDSMSTVECYDPITNIWNSAEDMKTVRSRVGVAVLNGKNFKVIYNISISLQLNK